MRRYGSRVTADRRQRDRSKTPPAPEDARSDIHDDDAALFREAIGDTRPLAQAPEAPKRRPPPPRPRQREADEREAVRTLHTSPFDVDAVEVGEELLYARDGLSPKVLRRLRRGQYAIQDEIDLHQMNATLADQVLREFLACARERGVQCVRIVHGKGLRSPRGPVLKGVTERHLRQRGDVLAFASARPAQGGTGATIVLLARRRDRAAAGADALSSTGPVPPWSTSSED